MAIEHRGFVEDLALVLCVAAVTTVLCRKLRQPVVLGYLLAGLIVGPFVPVPLFADTDRIHTLSELGVILVMFAIGLEFSFRKLMRLAPSAGIIALIQISVMMWLGFVTGQLLGWTVRESVFAGGIIAISSTMIIAKAFSEESVSHKVMEIVLGVLIFEDLAAVLMITVLTAFSAEGGANASVLTTAAFQLMAFLGILVAAGFLIVPRSVHAISKLKSPETLLIASVGLSFGFAYIAQKLGYSVALGAFLAGALVAESGHSHEVEELIHPLRDLFAAVFFVSVGMLMNPNDVLRNWVPVLVLTLITLLGKIASVTAATFLTGNDVRTSVQSGMSMAQIGEFSFIIAAVGLSHGAIREFLYPVAVAVSILTTLTTPWAIHNSERASAWIDRKLPQPFQTFVTLYGSWIDRLRQPGRPISLPRRLLWFLLIDSLLLIGLIIGCAIGWKLLLPQVVELTRLSEELAMWLIFGLALIVALPLIAGLVRSARMLGTIVATHAFTERSANQVDFAEAPRSLMVTTLEFGVVFTVSIVILAITQPFLPPVPAAVLILIILGIAFLVFRQRAANLQGHLRAGAQAIVESLAKQSRAKTAIQPEETLKQLENLLPGLGILYQVQLESSHKATGRTLAELNIHGRTGATVIAILRGEEGMVVPGGSEMLRNGDVLALIGTQEAVDAARQIFQETKDMNQMHETIRANIRKA